MCKALDRLFFPFFVGGEQQKMDFFVDLKLCLLGFSTGFFFDVVVVVAVVAVVVAAIEGPLVDATCSR